MRQVFLGNTVRVTERLDISPFSYRILADHIVYVEELVLNILLHLLVIGGIYLITALVYLVESLLIVNKAVSFLEDIYSLEVSCVEYPAVSLLLLLQLLGCLLGVSCEVLLGVCVHQRSFQILLILVVCDDTVIIELIENVLLTGLVVGTSVDDHLALVVFILYERTVFLRALWYSCKNSRFGYSELIDLLSEITDRSELYTVYRTAEADIIEIFLKYLVL